MVITLLKKIIPFLLVCLLIVSTAACSGQDGKSTTAPGGTTAPDGTTAPEGTTVPSGLEGPLSELVDAIYDKMEDFNIELLPTAAVDLANSDQVKGFLGLDSAAGVKEAVYSEPVMMPTTYSLVLVRVESGADIEQIKTAMCNGVDMMKWVCMGAEKVLTNNSGDVIMLVMSSADTCADVESAFSAVADGNVGDSVTRVSSN